MKNAGAPRREPFGPFRRGSRADVFLALFLALTVTNTFTFAAVDALPLEEFTKAPPVSDAPSARLYHAINSLAAAMTLVGKANGHSPVPTRCESPRTAALPGMRDALIAAFYTARRAYARVVHDGVKSTILLKLRI